MWEFQVVADGVDEFKRHYGPDGSWALLFRRAEGYIGTLLLQDRQQPLRYITIDRWRSETDYRAFRARYDHDYLALDKLCENLTTRETALGELEEVD